MILFAILLLGLLVISLGLLLVVGVGGTAFMLVFGDVIICIVLIVIIVRSLFKRRKK